MTKANPNTAQQMTEGLTVETFVRKERGALARMIGVRSSLLGEGNYWNSQAYLVDPTNNNAFTAAEVLNFWKRVVMCVKLMQETSDEDLKNLYDAKFGAGDGL